MEQNCSLFPPENIAIRNKSPETPEPKPICRRWLPEPGVPAGELPRHLGSESRLGARSSPRGHQAFGERGFTGQPAVPARAGLHHRLRTGCGFIAFTVGPGQGGIIWGSGWEPESIPPAGPLAAHSRGFGRPCCRR